MRHLTRIGCLTLWMFLNGLCHSLPKKVRFYENRKRNSKISGLTCEIFPQTNTPCVNTVYKYIFSKNSKFVS